MAAKFGYPVTFYTHEASDTVHSTNDAFAIVLKVVDDHTCELVIFPVGGPTRYERVSDWDEDALLPPPGGSYWRDQDSKPPDFAKAYAHYNSPEWAEMLYRQRGELERTPVKDREGLLEEHKKEQEELYAKLEEEKAPKKLEEVKKPPEPTNPAASSANPVRRDV